VIAVSVVGPTPRRVAGAYFFAHPPQPIARGQQRANHLHVEIKFRAFADPSAAAKVRRSAKRK
jgi:hypothetical protein